MKRTWPVFALFTLLWLAIAAVARGDALYTYDLTYTFKRGVGTPADARRVWDETHFVSSVQGIVNRERPRLYLFLVGGETGSVDRFWLETLRRPGEWLAPRNPEPIPDLPALIARFRADLDGLVVYDEKVPATSNVASTIAGVRRLACVRYDAAPGSLYQWLTANPDGPHLPVKSWLINRDGSSLFTGRGTLPGSRTPSSGSAKCDAYLWAKERFLDTGLCDPRRLAYYLDAWWIAHPDGYLPNHTLSNHDYFIAHRGFFFDLSPWDDETPVDDRTQPLGTDRKTLQAILRSAYDRLAGKGMIHAGGFVPWAWKYTNYGGAGGKHEGVPTEWRYAEILSCFNAYMDADALGLSAMANASVYQHYPLAPRYPQPKPTLADLKARGLVLPDGRVAPRSYVAIYGGDYDSAAWLYQKLPEIWNDPARGKVPVGWAFNPNLADRFAAGMAYVRRTKTPNDTFIAGDSGAGYLNPGNLAPPRQWSGLPSGVQAWSEHCARYFQQWDLSVTGFVIDGYAPPMTDAVKDAYASFSADGIVGQKVPRLGMHRGMPIVRMEWDLDSPERASELIVSRCRPEKPEFFVYRTILWPPSSLQRMMDLAKAAPGGADVEFVDPYTLMRLVKQHFEGPDKGVARPAPVRPLAPGEVANVWDVRRGAVVTGHSEMVPGSDARDLFGGTYGSLESHDLVIFADGKPDGFTHWVEWRTARPMRLRSYRLHALGDQQTQKREFAAFRLFARRSSRDPWTLVDQVTPDHPYAFENTDAHLLRSHTLPAPLSAQEFRAEFIQRTVPGEMPMGPRVLELTGTGTLQEMTR